MKVRPRVILFPILFSVIGFLGIWSSFWLYESSISVSNLDAQQADTLILEAEFGARQGEILPHIISDPTASAGSALWLESRYGTDFISPSCNDIPDAITITPSDDVTAIVNSGAAGTTFCFVPGIHRVGLLFLKDNQTFIGETGAVLSGAKELGGWAPTPGRTGVWQTSWPGQTIDTSVWSNQTCADGTDLCRYVDDIFVNDVFLPRQASLAAVDANPNTSYVDYQADTVYISRDPAGRLVEYSDRDVWTPFRGAGNPGDANITIQNLILEKSATDTSNSFIAPDNSGWVVQNNEVRFVHGSGLKTPNYPSTFTGNYIHHNGQKGIGGGGTPLFDANELAYNNTAGYNDSWEAGGSKFVRTTNAQITNNYVHHNDGPGLWTDIDNVNPLFDGNVSSNNTEAGIFHEISYGATITNNTVRGNGTSNNWPFSSFEAGIAVSSSQGTAADPILISTNLVDRNRNSIAVRHDTRRPTGTTTTGADHVRIENNTIVQFDTPSGTIHTGGQYVSGSTDFFLRDITFDNNTYLTDTGSPADKLWQWDGAAQDFTYWQTSASTPQDTNSVLGVATDTRYPPCVTLPPNGASFTQAFSTSASGAVPIAVVMKAFDHSNDSVYVQVNNDCPVVIGDQTGELATGQWETVSMIDGDPSTSYAPFLAAGSHIITVYQREAHVQVDRLEIGSAQASPPNTLSVTSFTADHNSPTSQQVISASIVFSEPVLTVDAADFAVSQGGISSVTGSGDTYNITVAVPEVDYSQLEITIAPDNTIQTQSGQMLTGVLPTVSYMVDRVGPSVASFAVPANQTGWDYVDMAWTASDAAPGLLTARLERSPVAPIDPLLNFVTGQSSYSDQDVTPSTTYTYTLTLQDTLGNQSDPVSITETTLAKPSDPVLTILDQPDPYSNDGMLVATIESDQSGSISVDGIGCSAHLGSHVDYPVSPSDIAAATPTQVYIQTSAGDGDYTCLLRVEAVSESVITLDQVTVDTQTPSASMIPIADTATNPLIYGIITDSAPSSGITESDIQITVAGETGQAASYHPVTGEWTYVPTVSISPGIYDVRVQVADAAGNVNDQTFADILDTTTTVVQNNPPMLDLGAASQRIDLALASSMTLTASVLDDPEDTHTYAWSGPSGVSFSDTAIPNPTLTFTGPGEYTVSVVVTDDGGLQATASMVIMVTQTPSTSGGSSGGGGGGGSSRPSRLSVQQVTETTATISWRAARRSEGYQIDCQSLASPIIVDAQQTSVTITGLSPNATHECRVASLRRGRAGRSTAVTIQTGSPTGSILGASPSIEELLARLAQLRAILAQLLAGQTVTNTVSSPVSCQILEGTLVRSSSTVPGGFTRVRLGSSTSTSVVGQIPTSASTWSISGPCQNAVDGIWYPVSSGQTQGWTAGRFIAPQN